MLLFETLDEHGKAIGLHLEARNGELWLLRDDGSLRATIAPRVVIAVMQRYGREVDPEVELSGDELSLDPQHRLRRFRFRAGVDAEGRDYLALLPSQGPPLAAMATSIAAALDHLANAMASRA